MSINHFRRGLLLASILCFLVAPLVTSVAYAADVTVFAAASLKNALDDVTKLYEAKTGDKVAISYAASPGLAKQIEAGAPADIFFSADLDWMDYLAQKISSTTLRGRRSGQYACARRTKGFGCNSDIHKDFPLLEALGPDGKLAMASVDSVPAGKYGKAVPDQPWGLGRSLAARGSGGKCSSCSGFGRHGRRPLGTFIGLTPSLDRRLKCGIFSRRKPPQDPVSRSRCSRRRSRKLANSSTSRISRGEAGLRGPGVHLFGQAKLEEPKVKKISA